MSPVSSVAYAGFLHWTWAPYYLIYSNGRIIQYKMLGHWTMYCSVLRT